jgi:hypothetical protein
MRLCPLSDALLELLPTAIITRRRDHAWHSATLSGMRMVLDLQIEGFDAARAKDFAAMIEDHEFSLPELLVADIAVTEQRSTGSAIMMTIEALLLAD